MTQVVAYSSHPLTSPPFTLSGFGNMIATAASLTDSFVTALVNEQAVYTYGTDTYVTGYITSGYFSGCSFSTTGYGYEGENSVTTGATVSRSSSTLTLAGLDADKTINSIQYVSGSNSIVANGPIHWTPEGGYGYGTSSSIEYTTGNLHLNANGAFNVSNSVFTGGTVSSIHFDNNQGDYIDMSGLSMSTSGTNINGPLDFLMAPVFDGNDVISINFSTGVTFNAGAGNDFVSGGVGGDILNGGTGNDTINGADGSDKLTGGAGSDLLSGATGNDTLIGGAGKDTFAGGAGKDTFDFNALSEIGVTSTTRDLITDFTHGIDKIDLSTLDANTATAVNNAFTTLISPSAHFTAAGQLQFVSRVLYGNTDSDSAAEFSIQLTGVTTFTTSDVIL